MERKKKQPVPKKNMIFSVSQDLDEEIKQIVTESGVSKSELGRRALKQVLDSGKDEAQVMLNFVMLTQTVNDIQDKISKSDYEQLQQYIGNIMQIKGGK